MSDPRTDLPNPKAANFNQRIRETLMTYLGRQGNPLDRGLTLRDLLENGLVKIRDGFTLKPGQSGTLPLEPIPADGEADLTPPPTPTGFAVSAAITHVFIEHDAPLYRQGHGHLRTRVYGKIVQAGDPLPTFTDATEITQFSGTVHAHPSNPATTWHLWIKWESVDGVLSTNPAGGTNGLSTTTGQDVALLLDALAGQITEGALYQTLNDRINLIDGPSTLDNSVAQRIAAEAQARANEIASEVAARVSADAAETQARIDAVAAETAARNDKIAIESHQRLEQVQSTGEAALNVIIAANNERIDRLTDVASARQELKTDFDAGILAEATARLELTAVVNQNVADILSEQTARSTADSALASSITTLTSQVNNNTAAIQSEATTRANADAVEATQRNLLAAQFRGDYTGNDINQVTSGLLYQERTARAAQDNALAQQITLLSAGAGEQFDWKKIWYFDDGAESWTGNGTPTVNQGWLRPANQASGAYVESPTGIGSDGNKYGQVRLRIRKVGSPTFAGFLWWRAAADTTWDAARRTALTAPTFDANGIGLITVSPAWTVTIDRIRLDLSSAQTATDYFEIDWVAVGRPSPGASSAQLLEEQEARATADAAEATERKTLSSTLIGQENPDGVTLSGLTSGLLFEERQARSTQDTAIATSVTSLQTTVTNNYTTLSSAITDEATARSTADTSEANARKSLSATLTGLEDPSGKTLADLTSGLVFDEKNARVTADGALSESITGLNSTVGTLSADLLTVQQTVADLDSATASSVTSLVVADRRNEKTMEELAEAALRDIVSLNKERKTRQETLAFAQESLSIKIEEGLEAEATARQLLSATVNENTASILAEQTARATADESITTTLTALIAQTGSDAQAAILAEQTARTTQDTALAKSITTLTTTVDNNQAALVQDYYTKTDADSATASAQQTLITSYGASNVFRQAAAPVQSSTEVTLADGTKVSKSAIRSGDIWFDTGDGNKPHVWSGAEWVYSPDTSVAASTAYIDSLDSALASSDKATIQSFRTAVAKVDIAETSLDTRLTTDYNAIVGESGAIATNASYLRAYADIQSKVFRQDAAPTSRGTDPETEAVLPLKSGDAWFDTDDGNKPYVWNGTAWVTARDGAIGAVDARVTSVETTKIGYATKGGVAFDNNGTITDKAGVDAWNAANPSDLAVWHAGLPLATAVKQVSVTDANGEAAAIEQAFTAQKTLNDGFKGLYTLKLDINGNVSGFGLYGTETNSEFIVNADKFAVTTPTTSIPLRANSKAYTVGSIARVAGVDDRTLVCKVAGTTASSAPAITGIGTVVTDGSVRWQVASRVPFAVQATPTSIGGVAVPAGVYVDAAYILNATINTAQIANEAVDNSKIADVSVSKLTSGSIAVGDYIQSTGYVAGSAGWRINGDGNAEFSNATVRGTVYATNGQFWGTLLGGAASAYATGLGFYAGGGTTSSGANYRWRVGNPSGARIQWNGSAVEVYNASNELTISSGGISSSYVTGLGGFATLDEITAANIGTYIADAAVDTLYIAGNAVTVPVSVTLSEGRAGNAILGGAANVLSNIGHFYASQVPSTTKIYVSVNLNDAYAQFNYLSGTGHSFLRAKILRFHYNTSGVLTTTYTVDSRGECFITSGGASLYSVDFGPGAKSHIVPNEMTLDHHSRVFSFIDGETKPTTGSWRYYLNICRPEDAPDIYCYVSFNSATSFCMAVKR